jgi:hypothetical protein
LNKPLHYEKDAGGAGGAGGAGERNVNFYFVEGTNDISFTGRKGRKKRRRKRRRRRERMVYSSRKSLS